MDDMKDWGRDANASEKSYVLLAFAIIVAIAGAAGLGYYLTLPKVEYAISASAFSRLDSKARTLALRLNEEPCNREVAARLANTLANSAEYSATVSFVQVTEKKCGPNEYLWSPLVNAQVGLSDYAAAEKTLARALELHPNSAQAFFERGSVRSKREDFAGAYQDYRRAIYVYSNPSLIGATAFEGLAQAAAKLGRPCEAVATLQDYVAFDNLERRTPALLGLMRDWQKQGSCPSPFGNGTTRLRYVRNLGAIILPVKVNGVEGRMIVDTGASRTVLTRGFAAHAGIEAADEDGAMTHTANGAVWAMGGRAEKISLGEARTSNVPVFIQTPGQTGFGPGIDGLLGLSFLGNFKFTVDNGVLELQPLK